MTAPVDGDTTSGAPSPPAPPKAGAHSGRARQFRYRLRLPRRPPAPAPPVTLLAVGVLLTALSLAVPTSGMLALLWLSASSLLGRVLVSRAFPDLPPLPALAGSVLVGLIVATWLSFGVALALAPVTERAVPLGGLLTVWLSAALAWRERHYLRRGWQPPSSGEWLFVAAALIAALWLFNLTLIFDRNAGEPTISASGWPDFGLHLPLARSFSFGHNLPPQYPLYAGPGIHYHFGFDFLAGLLERLGLRLDLAFNLPAALGLASLLVLLFHQGRELCGRALGGVLAALLVPFSSSWAFVDYVQSWRHTPVGLLSGWWNQAEKLPDGPWNPANPSHWHFTLAAYLNQRQLTLGIATALLVLVPLLPRLRSGGRLTDGQAALLGAFLGLTYPLNAIVWLGALATCGALMLLFRRIREGLYLGGYAVAVAAPVALLLSSGDRPSFHPGYIIDPFTPRAFLGYWWENVGLLPWLALAALPLLPARDRRIFLALWLPFLIGHLFQMARDHTGTNHKLFNLWTAYMALYAGATLVRLAHLRLPRPLPSIAGAALATLLVSPTLLSGLTDLSLMRNERHYNIDNHSEQIAWIRRNTAPDAVFLTQPWLYTPPSIAGRLVYLGWPGWPEGAGYDTRTRGRILEEIFRASSPAFACVLLRREGIDYVQAGPDDRAGATPRVNAATWDQFRVAYEQPGPNGPIRYYDVAATCR